VWEPHNGPHDLKFFKISNQYIKMVRDPFKKRIRFWDRLGIPDIPTEEEILYQYNLYQKQIPKYYGAIEDNSLFVPYNPSFLPFANSPINK